MKQFIHKPQHLKTHRILPGHGNGSRFTDKTPLPNVDRTERQARRHGWTDRQAERRIRYGVGGSIGLVGAVFALVVMLLAAIGPRANVLDTPAPETVQVVDVAPGASAQNLEG